MSSFTRFKKAIVDKDIEGIIFIGLYLVLAISLAVFHLYTALMGVMDAWQQKAIHLALAAMIASIYPFSTGDYKKWKHKNFQIILSIVSFLIAVAFLVYARIDQMGIQFRSGNPNNVDTIFFFLICFILFVNCKRYVGWPLVIIGMVFFAYIFLGQYLPKSLAHGGFSLKRIVDSMFITGRGIFGDALYASSVYVVVFVLFGSFLTQTKVGDYFIKFSDLVAGRFRGGPAKVAVVSSALVGTISGSGPGNVATTGSFTIPMMKRLGYENEFAAAVESAASTGGILMPPVMGATAFIMAEMTSIKYSRICLAALIPAILYFTSVFFMVHFEAIRMDLTPVPKEEIPSGKYIWSRVYLFAPIIAIIVALVMGFSAMRAGIYGIIACIVISCFRKETRLNLERLISSLEGSSKEIITIAIACGVAGIIAGSINLTGLGLKLSYVINTLSGGYTLIAMILIMVLCIILGMGMPVTAAFIITYATCSIVTKRLGLDTLTSSMFMFYFATLSAVTPPVALSSYTAAGIAGANLNKTGWKAFKLCIAGFIVPYMILYSPELIMIGTPFNIVRAGLTATIGVIMLASAIEGWNFKWKLHWISRISLTAASLMLIDSGLITDVCALAILIIVYLFEKVRARKGTVIVNKFGKTLAELNQEKAAAK
jgi:TRAP transporter 4TM/12TM fusion protein